MFHLLEKRIAEAFASRIESLYGVAGPVQTEQPKQASFGEISVPAAFQLARQLKKAPKAIAGGVVGGGGSDRGRVGDRDRGQRVSELAARPRILCGGTACGAMARLPR